MKKSIWKFQLETTDYQKISMPKNAQILTVQIQNETPCIWAICNADAEKEDREFEILGTGHPYRDDIWMGKEHSYIGTYQLHSGSLVFHLFELRTSLYNGL